MVDHKGVAGRHRQMERRKRRDWHPLRVPEGGGFAGAGTLGAKLFGDALEEGIQAQAGFLYFGSIAHL